jgi:WhiB family transcriptional regulator, redox-sensing transcriptional regulator
MTTKPDSRSWWALAACQTVSTELFFPVTETGPARLQVSRAKAMSTHQAHGVWGGLSESERRSLRAELTTPQIGRAS